MSAPLQEALDRLVPSCDTEFGDWERVLAAAGVTRAPATAEPAAPLRGRRLTRRQLIAAALSLGAVTILFATPAFGLRALILDFVGGRTSVSFEKSRPAPAAIKKRFLDVFSVGAPAGMDQGVLPDQAREITFRGAAGQKRVLWVAPTRARGFCFIIVGAGGGCTTKEVEQENAPVVVDGAFSQRPGEQPRFLEVNGRVFSPKVATLTLEFQDHWSMPIPFVYVSSPINAGFFLTGVPSDHQRPGHWPTSLVARDGHGAILGTRMITVPTGVVRPLPPSSFPPQPPRTLPTASEVAPSAPTQTASADGITVIAGANGDVRVAARNLSPELARLLGRAVSVSCFRLTREFGIFTVRGDGVSGAFANSIGFNIHGIGRPLDGCEIASSRGHRWPDTFGSHSPVELALTAKGRAYFADRVAARDLSLFVRSGRMQAIRKENGSKLVHEMKTEFGAELARSRIRWSLTPNGITFIEESVTGRTFRVIVEHGRIVRSNVRPYAKVF
jgi:hypothetical protein